MVEGVLQPRSNAVSHSIGIPHYIDSSNSQHAKPQSTHIIISDPIAPPAIAVTMNVAINFHYQPRFKAAEVSHIRPDRMLTAEASP